MRKIARYTTLSAFYCTFVALLKIKLEAEEEEEKPKLKDKLLALAEAEKKAKKNRKREIDGCCRLSPATVYEDYDCMLNQTNIGNNNNKFYVIQLLVSNGNYYVWNRWGRVVSSNM